MLAVAAAWPEELQQKRRQQCWHDENQDYEKQPLKRTLGNTGSQHARQVGPSL